MTLNSRQVVGESPTASSSRPGTLAFFEVRDVYLHFGGVVALDGLSFTVTEHELCAVIGPNGAGKSSLFNCVCGVYRPERGTISLDGVDLLRLPPHKIAELAVARTFQNLALVPSMTVLENVLLGGHLQHRSGLTAIGGALRLPGERRGEIALRRDAMEWLDRMTLFDVADTKVSSLPYGWQKRVEIARAMMARPRLLLVDEPAAGLTHDEVLNLGQLIRSLRDEFALTVLLVEHHMGLVTTFADRCVVLNAGQLIADGRPVEVVKDPAVVAAYLGEETEE